MKKILLLACCSLLVAGSFSQTISQKLQTAFQKFSNDTQLKHAISSLYVIDAKSGKVVFDKNSQIGLIPASTLKIITAATAFELLGKDYRFKTEFGVINGLRRSLYVKGSGDPTFGSWRWESTSENSFLKRLRNAIVNANIDGLDNVLVSFGNNFDEPVVIPDGWIWQDIGNYYGAASQGLNWRENQFDIILKSGKKIGDTVIVLETRPRLYFYDQLSIATAASKGSGGNAYIYLPVYPGIAGNTLTGIIKGTIPVSEDSFVISGSLTFPQEQFAALLLDSLKNNFAPGMGPKEYSFVESAQPDKIFYTEFSPSLDSIIYWFLQKSINLYGEALVKTFAYEKTGMGAADSGISIIKNFWKQKGIDPNELIIGDGSGLSPQNRMTTHAQVEVLKYAKRQSWFSYFYDALPEYNNMKMKSGTIKGAKGFTGYHTSKSGNDYIFSFLVNNYNGSPSALVKKMFTVLNVLK